MGYFLLSMLFAILLFIYLTVKSQEIENGIKKDAKDLALYSQLEDKLQRVTKARDDLQDQLLAKHLELTEAERQLVRKKLVLKDQEDAEITSLSIDSEIEIIQTGGIDHPPKWVIRIDGNTWDINDVRRVQVKEA